MATKTTPSRRQRRMKVGDRVNIIFGEQRLPAVVVEDRGDLGVGGRQIVGIRQLDVPDYMAGPFELSVDEIELVNNGNRHLGRRASRGRK